MRSLSILTALAAAIAVAAGQACDSNPRLTRKEWGSLTRAERTDYIDAVWCLRKSPSALPNSGFPGVKDRFDDFVATHINYTTIIHKSGLFLPWHRHFIFLWEKALRDECGYKGAVPYWDWNIIPNLYDNPIFDNTPTSLSGDGIYNAAAQSDRDSTITDLPPGNGGGCVIAGPFKDFPVHLGPFTFAQAYSYAPLPANAFAYNPRCLQRNLQPAVIQKFNTPAVMGQLLSAPDINAFLAVMDPSAAGVMGPHGGGHDAVGPTMADVFASPQDPVFMLHHAMVDRMWWLWQGRDQQRIVALNGTAVINNPPQEELVTVDSVVEFGVLDRPRRLGDLMDSFKADYCFQYQ